MGKIVGHFNYKKCSPEFFFNLSLLPFTKVESQIDHVLTDSLEKSNDWSLVSEMVQKTRDK